jgi:uncharacterized protein (DUF2141 family)
MKKLFFLTYLLTTLSHAAPLKISFQNLGNHKGQVAIAIYNDQGSFPDKSKKAKIVKFIQNPKGLNVLNHQEDLPPGEYAMSVFYDENFNQIMDKNLIGIPKERFGFSNNPTITIGAPGFSESSFFHSEKGTALTIKMNKML